MKAVTNWFNKQRGYGFIADLDSKKDLFVHQSNIKMKGFRYLNENDIVNYDVGTSKNGREQAVNVRPILTRGMIEDSLREEKLYIKTVNVKNVTKYIVVDVNNALQTNESGISFLDLAAFAGFDIEGLSV